MNKKILCIILLSIIVSASAEYEERMQEELQHADADEKAGNYDAAASGYYGAADYAASDKNYDKAIEYELKGVEMRKKTSVSYAVSYGIIAKYYSKKSKLEGIDYNDKIREYCEIEEKLLLEEIDIELNNQLNNTKPSYTTVYSKYGSIVTCYGLLTGFSYGEKTCKYCSLHNEYAEKERKISGGDIAINDCSYLYDCPKSTTPGGSASTDIGSSNYLPSGSNLVSFILPAVVVGLLILLIAGFLVSKGRKKGSKKT
ncbi:MAG: hypothetical protein WAX07_04835 [Candidatus Altiarchaeia archaeon]